METMNLLQFCFSDEKGGLCYQPHFVLPYLPPPVPPTPPPPPTVAVGRIASFLIRLELFAF